MSSQIEIIDNFDKRRFEHHVEGEMAIMEYILSDQDIYLTNTIIPESMRHTGLGNDFVLSVLTNARNRDLLVNPMCPFVAEYIRNNPEWKSNLMPGAEI